MALSQDMGKRKSQRHTVIWSATLSDLRGTDRRCTVLNISEGGACLKIDDAQGASDTADINIAGLGQFRATRAWARDNRVGMAFMLPPAAIRPALDRALASRLGAH
jgi:hypothetical protein